MKNHFIFLKIKMQSLDPSLFEEIDFRAKKSFFVNLKSFKNNKEPSRQMKTIRINIKSFYFFKLIFKQKE
jgi:hypothetical protein